MREYPALVMLRHLSLLWFLAGTAVGALCLYALRALPEPRRATWVQRLSIAASALVLAMFFACTLYTLRCQMLDPDEANILTIAAAMSRQPVYHSLTSPDFSYSLRYGPYVFLIYRLGLIAGGGRFFAVRLLVMLADLAVVAALYNLLRQSLSRASALILLALPVAVLQQFWVYTFGMRGDIWIFLAITLACRFSMLSTGWLAALLAGVALGVAVGLKATAIVAAIIVLTMLYHGRGKGLAAIGAASTVLITLAPFALQAFSLRNYIAWLDSVRGEGIDPGRVILSAAYAVFLFSPLAVLRLSRFRFAEASAATKASLFLAPSNLLLVTGAIAVACVASKPGSGSWHFFQLLPLVMAATAVALAAAKQDSSRARSAMLLIAMGSVVVSLEFIDREVTLLRLTSVPAYTAPLNDAQKEIDTFLVQYAGRPVQMGYGNRLDEPLSTLRYRLALHGEPYTLDGSHRTEVWAQPFPAHVLERMQTCTDDVWLLPHGARPFASRIFSQAFRDSFTHNYRVDSANTGVHPPQLDAWVCANNQH